MDQSILIIVIIAAVVGIFYLLYYFEKKQIEKLKNVAEKFGLLFTSGKELRAQMKNEIQNSGLGVLDFTKRMQLLGRRWDMSGTYNSVKVHIYPILRQQGRRAVAYTKVVALFKKNFNAGLQISKEGFFSKMGKALGGQDLQTGNEEFDKKFIIKGTNESVILALLQKPEVQKAISDLFAANGDAFINDEGFGIERLGTITKEEVYRSLLDQLAMAVKMCGM